MTTSAVGLVVDEHDAGIAGLNAVIEDVLDGVARRGA